jgi:hypothetical protein
MRSQLPETRYILATFDGPPRAVRCAVAVRDALRGLGLEMRAGVHTRKCELTRSRAWESAGSML